MTAAGASQWPRAIAIVVVAAGVFVAGQATGSITAREVVTRGADRAPAASRPSPALAALSAVELTAVLRAAVRDEIRSVLTEQREAGQDSNSTEETAPADEPSPDSLAATERGLAVIGTARRAGRWRSEDASALRAVMQAVTDDQRKELLAELIPAINRGEVTPDFRGPIF
jgi:hypothetical protein